MKNIEQIVNEIQTIGDEQKVINNLPLLTEENFAQFIMPSSKSYWEYAAHIIAQKGKTNVNQHIPELITWLQDMNWPGSRIILQVLSQADYDHLLLGIKQSLKKAGDQKDEMWIAGINLLMKKACITVEELNDATYAEILKIGKDMY